MGAIFETLDNTSCCLTPQEGETAVFYLFFTSLFLRPGPYIYINEFEDGNYTRERERERVYVCVCACVCVCVCARVCAKMQCLTKHHTQTHYA
jgi:hypothetical protein